MNTSVDNTQTITTTTNNENNSPLTKPRPMLMSLKEIIDIERNPRKNKKIIINLTGTKYDVVFEVAREYFTWNIISEKSELVDDWNIQWYDTYISTDTLRAMCPYQKINHFPGSYNLGRKNLLARNLAKMRKFLPNEYNFYPKTWLLPYQYEEMKSYVDGINDKSAKKKVVLIVKPEASCQGRGIFLTKKVEGQIAPQEHYVVQEYIAEPLLIDDYKFDLRVYALVKSVHPLKIFVYREGLGRFATVKYEKPKKKNMKNMYMHLTNYAVNKKNPEFQFNEEETNDAVGHKRSLTALLKYLGDKGENSEKIFEDICSVISKTICSVQPHLAHIYRTCQPKEENSEMCFEVFGFDIMLDKKFRPVVLEVNHTPSFTTDSPLDLHIKRNLILDTMILMNVINKNKKRYLESKNLPNMVKTFAKMPPQELEEMHKKISKFEDKHMGGYVRVYPPAPGNTKINYASIFEVASNLWNDMTNPKKAKNPMEHNGPTPTAHHINAASTSYSGNLSLNSTPVSHHFNNLNSVALNKIPPKRPSISKQKSESIQGSKTKPQSLTSVPVRPSRPESKDSSRGTDFTYDKLDENHASNTSLSLQQTPLATTSTLNALNAPIIHSKYMNNINNINNFIGNSLCITNNTLNFAVNKQVSNSCNGDLNNSFGTTNPPMGNFDRTPMVMNPYGNSNYGARFKSKMMPSSSKLPSGQYDVYKQNFIERIVGENGNFNQYLAENEDSDKSLHQPSYGIRPPPLPEGGNEDRSRSVSPARKLVKRPSSSNHNFHHNMATDSTRNSERLYNTYENEYEKRKNNSLLEGHSLIEEGKKYLNLQKLSIRQKNEVYETNNPNEKVEVVHSARRVVYDRNGYKVVDTITKQKQQLTPVHQSKGASVELETKLMYPPPQNQMSTNMLLPADKSKGIVQILDNINLPFDSKINVAKCMMQGNKFTAPQKFRTLKSYIFNDSVNFRKNQADFKIKLANLQNKFKRDNKE